MIYFKLLNVPLLNVLNLKYLLRVSNLLNARSNCLIRTLYDYQDWHQFNICNISLICQIHTIINNIELMPVLIMSNFDSTRVGG